MFENMINSFLSLFSYNRQKQWKRYLTEPAEVQREQWEMLLRKAQHTEYGKKYGFGGMRGYEDYAASVPLTDYEHLRPYIERMQNGEKDILWPGRVKYYAMSSGTTSTRSKFIPIPDEILENNHFRGGKDMLLIYLNRHPDSKMLMGKSLKLGGTTRYDAERDIYIGDLSGIMIDRLPFWAQYKSSPPDDISRIGDWHEKLELIRRRVIKEDIRSLVGIPTWFMKLLQQMLDETGKERVADIWPNLEVFFHGGISFQPYRAYFDRLIGKPDMRYMEIYNASEGFFALQSDLDDPGLQLMLDYRIFYEFIPMKDFRGTDSKRVIPLEEVEEGVNYALVISSASGLWRYIVGDTVSFTSLKPYKIKITGRTKHFLNIVGEEVVVENTDRALKRAAERFGLNIIDYTVSAVPPAPDRPGYHEWMIEFETPPADPEAFAAELDAFLRELNSDYDIKRTGNISLLPLKMHVARKGLFDSWMDRHNKLGGQHKVPRLTADRSFMEELLIMNNEQ